jgi:hypothetical protein
MLLGTTIFLFAAVLTLHGQAFAASPASSLDALVSAYPTFIDRIEGNELVWKDGTRMRINDGRGEKSFDELVSDPDIKDMFSMIYPAGEKGIPPAANFDPGRIRYIPLFTKMYGDCRTAKANATDVIWLRSKYAKKIQFTRVNAAAAALQKISDDLDQLPSRFLEYLTPLQGTYNCRPIAQTSRPSPHSFGIAIDLAGLHADYWLWSKPDASGRVTYRNQIPWEVVGIFEKHGFLWGGKWYHFDTMHFEYRPEILMNAK